ncbi:MAG TPA: hypothetical protein EYP53_05320 [Candidatus Latescibacteria bacterium]|nr:hypothetical protein [Candidatus Latescibacterota bacterium]
MIRCSAPGRAGIIGNPSDMYGGSVISCTTQERAEVILEESDQLSFESGGKNLVVKKEEDLLLNGDEFDIPRAVVRFLGLEGLKVKLHLKTDIPLRAGLSGSTAMLVATLNALLAFTEEDLNRFQRAELARQIELDLMKIVCGYQDAYMCTFGGINFMDFRDKQFYRGPEKEPYGTVESLNPYVKEIPFVVAHTGLQRVSGSVHKPIRDRWLEGEKKVLEAYVRMAQLARMGKKALIEEDWEKLGALMNENHHLQRDLGGSGEKNEELIRVALECGALGAKLAGAGGGGTIIALHLEPEEMIQFLKNAGAEKILIPKPSEGVMVEVNAEPGKSGK